MYKIKKSILSTKKRHKHSYKHILFQNNLNLKKNFFVIIICSEKIHSI